MINDCLKSAFDELSDLPTAHVPFFTIDTSDTFKLSLLCDKAGFDQASVATPIEIYCNEPMERLLAGFYFMYGASGNSYAKLVIESTSANTISDSYNQVIIQQEQASALSNWSPIKSVAFLSNNLPIRKSLIGHDSDFGTESVNNGVSTSRDLSIITEIPMNELNKDDMGTITYKPLYEKLLDLNSSAPISDINVQLYYSDGPHYHPIILHTSGHIELVLNFHLRKDL